MAIAEAMDMYWREADGIYFLACSNQDPRQLSRIEYKKKIVSEMQPFLRMIEEARVLPSGLPAAALVQAPRAINSLGPLALTELENLAVPDGEVDRERIYAFMRDPKKRIETVQFLASATPWVRANQGAVGIGGICIWLEWPGG